MEAFEKEFADYINCQYCVGVASGLDALWIGFRILGIGVGDEVIVQANTYIASVMGITINGATPIFVEPDIHYGMDPERIEKAITQKTKAILVTHLYGMPSKMDIIKSICVKYGLRLVEDCAQSHGASVKGVMVGTFGDIGCFSFYPTKNLGGFGEGGAIVTNSAVIAEKIRVFRNYGSHARYYNEVVGTNSRLDELQAGLLRVKLSHLDQIILERELIARRYNAEINNKCVFKPILLEDAKTVWHQFVIRCDERDRLAEYLQKCGIGTAIHYPLPPHLQTCYRYLGHREGDFPIAEKYANTILSLPIYNGMTYEEQTYVIDAINRFEA